MIAMFDYNPKEQSPNINPDDELSFRSGEIIYVHGNVQEDGFFLGELENGRRGLVPSNFLKEISSINAEENSFQQDNEQQIISNDNKVPYRASTPFLKKNFLSLSLSLENILSSVR